VRACRSAAAPRTITSSPRTPGPFDSGGLAIDFRVAAIPLSGCLLALDFEQVQDAIAHDAPREESWPAVFGLSVASVWIHLEALRVLTLLREDAWSA
jgi:uncharacterized YccA/Bax inhibitor family protein